MTESSFEIAFRGNKNVFMVRQSPLAFGRASVLWLAKDSAGNLVCVKAFRKTNMPPNKLNEFLNELIARQALDHPNILPILDYGFGQGDEAIDPFIVLPYCTGGSLREVLRGRDFVSLNVFLPILEQIAEAIDFAHANGIIHGDIKPENILFREEKRTHACLADFGIATFFPISEEITTKAGAGAGTTAYLSPEQIESSQQTPLSDIYALTTVAYEALAGQLPFDVSASAFRQMVAKVSGEIIDPRTINMQLSDAVCQALRAGLSVKPHERPHSGKELCQQLKREKGSSGAAPTAEEQAPSALDRKRMIKLHQTLSERFGESDLRTLCFYLGVGYDTLPGEGTASKAMELITYLARRNRITELVEAGQQLRPDIVW